LLLINANVLKNENNQNPSDSLKQNSLPKELESKHEKKGVKVGDVDLNEKIKKLRSELPEYFKPKTIAKEKDSINKSIEVYSTTTHYYCQSSNNSILWSWICDGITDCPYGDDENDCNYAGNETQCDRGQYLCYNRKQCVTSNWLCDGVWLLIVDIYLKR
jgi:hypothetical protein